jgi:hypothetical protein
MSEGKLKTARLELDSIHLALDELSDRLRKAREPLPADERRSADQALTYLYTAMSHLEDCGAWSEDAEADLVSFDPSK